MKNSEEQANESKFEFVFTTVRYDPVRWYIVQGFEVFVVGYKILWLDYFYQGPVLLEPIQRRVEYLI